MRFSPFPHRCSTHIFPNLKSWIVYFWVFFSSANQLRRGKAENVRRREKETAALLLERQRVPRTAGEIKCASDVTQSHAFQVLSHMSTSSCFLSVRQGDFGAPDIPKSMAWCENSICVGFKRDYYLIRVCATGKDDIKLFITAIIFSPHVNVNTSWTQSCKKENYYVILVVNTHSHSDGFITSNFLSSQIKLCKMWLLLFLHRASCQPDGWPWLYQGALPYWETTGASGCPTGWWEGSRRPGWPDCRPEWRGCLHPEVCPELDRHTNRDG